MIPNNLQQLNKSSRSLISRFLWIAGKPLQWLAQAVSQLVPLSLFALGAGAVRKWFNFPAVADFEVFDRLF